MDSDGLIGIAFFLTVFGVVYCFVYFRYRTRKVMQATLRAAIERGQDLSAETVLALTGQTAPSANRDLRRGLILLAVALATAGFGVSIDDGDSTRVFLGAAMFPLLIGFAYLIISRFGEPAAR